MAYLFLYLAVTLVGYVIGARFKKKNTRISWIGPVQTVVISILVFIMGTRIGANDKIVESLDTIGLVAFVYTMIIMASSVAGFFVARKLFGFDRYGIRRAKKGDRISDGLKANSEKADQKPCATEELIDQGIDRVEDESVDRAEDKSVDRAEDENVDRAGDEARGLGVNRLTLLIVAFVVIGIIAGYFLMPDSMVEYTGIMLTVSLCMLLILIGLDIGLEGTIGQNFKSAGWRIIAFPFVSIISMMIGSIIAAIVLPLSYQDALCIGGGMGWYSLAPAMLAEYSARISAVSFMHNVFREVFGILLVPFVAKKIGYIECYSLPGSPSMDVCLPVIERSTSADVAVYSFITGAILSASVPVLVSIFMSI